jgi:hypothetical protein
MQEQLPRTCVSIASRGMPQSPPVVIPECRAPDIIPTKQKFSFPSSPFILEGAQGDVFVHSPLIIVMACISPLIFSSLIPANRL